MYIYLSYGSGGKQTSSLIHDIFLKHFDNEALSKLENAAVLDIGNRIATHLLKVNLVFVYEKRYNREQV